MSNDNNDNYLLRCARFSISRLHEPIHLLAYDIDSFKKDFVKHESILIIQRATDLSFLSIFFIGCGLGTVPKGDWIERFKIWLD